MRRTLCQPAIRSPPRGRLAPGARNRRVAHCCRQLRGSAATDNPAVRPRRSRQSCASLHRLGPCPNGRGVVVALGCCPTELPATLSVRAFAANGDKVRRVWVRLRLDFATAANGRTGEAAPQRATIQGRSAVGRSSHCTRLNTRAKTCIRELKRQPNDTHAIPRKT